MTASHRPIEPSRRRRHVAAALLLLLLSCATSVATAATLEVRGVAGTEIYVDGEWQGTLPLAAPFEVETGVRLLECRRPGYLVHREPVRVDAPDSAVIVEVDLLPLSRTRAVGSSLILAGLGQMYQGRTRIGWTMVAAQGAAWIAVMVAEGQFQTARDDFEVLDRQYQDAILIDEIARLRDERDAAYSDVESARDLRTVAIGAVVAVAAWSVIDAWRAHSSFFADAEVPEAQWSSAGGAGVESLQWRVGWRARF